MWAADDTSLGEDGAPKSDLACHSCRKRKIRCGRELPSCRVCDRTSQACQYPCRISKPGPKIGSTHRSNKRRRGSRSNDPAMESFAVSTPIEEEPSVSSFHKTASPSREDDGREGQHASFPARNRGQPMRSFEEMEEQDRPRRSSLIHDLSFILHPSHEASTSEKNTSPNSTGDALESGQSVMMDSAAYALSVTPDALEKMIKIYFDNMTAITLFHEPSFQEKVQSITSPAQTHALLASVLAFSARFCISESDENQDHGFYRLAGMDYRPAHFLKLASRYVDEALQECGDEPPPLCLLQALILLAHGYLTQGVRGKAWRSLGTCIRLAYELNLHLVDAGHPNQVAEVRQWCEYEEKRRAWWIIWEMDVFASTIRRCPTAVDWSQIETLLPVEDEYWFQGKPRPSCFLERDLGHRWKALQDSGNHSAKAWFIVINSMMKDAQSISSPRGIPDLALSDERRQSAKSSKDQKEASAIAEEAREKLETISNSVRCFVLALPPSLRYRNQYLGFDAREPGQTASPRHHHCGLYNIHVMTQLAKIMIHHYDIFSDSVRAGRPAQNKNSQIVEKSVSRTTLPISGGMSDGENQGLNQYFEAADEILRIVHRSSDDHIRHINAFLASTIWLASAVQLVRKEFGPPGTNRSLIKSRFEVLNMTYKKCVSFWDIQTAMQQNLETIESQLEILRSSGPKKEHQASQKADRRLVTRKDSWTNDSSAKSQSNAAIQYQNNETSSATQISHHQTHSANCFDSRASSLTNQPQSVSQDPSPINNIPDVQIMQRPLFGDTQQQQQQQQVGPMYMEPLSPALSTLDFMQLTTQMNKQPSPAMIDQEGLFSDQSRQDLCVDAMQGLAFGFHVDGWNVEYFDKLLSGAYTY